MARMIYSFVRRLVKMLVIIVVTILALRSEIFLFSHCKMSIYEDFSPFPVGRAISVHICEHYHFMLSGTRQS